MDGKVSLTFEDFGAAAAALNLQPAAVQAVHRVETAGRSGFLAPGLPEILFEGHIFWQRLKRRGIEPAAWQEGNGDILYPRWTREHYEGGRAEYRRLARALRIHEEAALESASWGMFQVMGFNHAACGYGEVRGFVRAMCASPQAQLDAFVQYLLAHGLDEPLRREDWAAFARRYNGPRYRENGYDTRLREAYLACLRPPAGGGETGA